MSEIAIIGMGCLFPEAASPQQYWDNLLAKRDCSTPLSSAELGVDPALYYNPVPGTPDKICYNRNGHVRGFHFDATGYRLPAAQLEELDDLFKWTVYAAGQALKDSGYDISEGNAARLGNCGLIIGNIGMPTHSSKQLLSGFYNRILEPYIQELLERPDFCFKDYWDKQGTTGSEMNLMSGSHNATVAALALGLSGPCYALDAACSSALYAIEMSSYYLRSGKADLMLSGAVCHADHIYIDHGFNMLQAFPVHGQSIPFDRRSEGLKAGEGACIVVLKRYADAVRDQDRIYGVIESVGLSNDSGAKHILVPDQKGQILALERAYASVDSAIDYLECHATGTPVGDQVELASIETFFARNPHFPLLGANKGNNGHMLTASGMASILKVLLSMREGVIPATVQVEEMVNTPQSRLGLNHIVRDTTEWPKRDAPKRAGINAFGFGGVNGHMVLREHVAQNKPAAAASTGNTTEQLPQQDLIVIVGLALALADTETKEAFNATIQGAVQHLRALPETRWLGLEARQDVLGARGFAAAPRGAYIEKFNFDCKRFKLPPKVVGNHLLSHMFLMPIAERAFLDAGYALDGKRRNIAVIVAGDLDYSCMRYQARNEISWQIKESLERCAIELSADQQKALETIVKDSLFPESYPEGITGGIGNMTASRIAAHLKLNGPAFVLASHENAGFKALELAEFMLSNHLVEAVIVATGSLAGGVENILWGHAGSGPGSSVGEGAGVLVLKRRQDAKAAKCRIYAEIRALELVHAGSSGIEYAPSSEAVARTATQCLDKAQVGQDEIDYIELYAGTAAGESAAEMDGLSQAYSARRVAEPIQVGTVKSNYGHLAAAAGIVSVIKTALCLFHRYLPGTPEAQDTGVVPGFVRQGSSRQWPMPASGLRKAAVSGMGVDRAYAHLILQEPDEVTRREAQEPSATVSTQGGGLVMTVYVGREKTIPQMILNPANRALFARPATPIIPAAPAMIAAPVIPAHVSVAQTLLQRQVQRNAQTHAQYLEVERAFYRKLSGLLSDSDSPHTSVAAPDIGLRPLFDLAQLLELTNGSVAKVLGPDYAEADTYAIRTRMPSPPYMFVSRITAMTAKKGVLEPCFIEWEYDLEPDEWFVSGGHVPAFVSLESSHAMIVAFTLIGCDQIFKGQLRYRAVDSQTTIYGNMPRPGEVLKGRVDILSFVKAGKNIIVSYRYLCHVGDRLAFKLEASSGFFTLKDMERSKGVNSAPYLKNTGSIKSFQPPLFCSKSMFTEADMKALQHGDYATCFGAAYPNAPGVQLYATDSKMLDRVASVDLRGGAFGLGLVIGERDIDPAHWAFKAHFKNDPVMPGTLLVEGCEQLVKFYLCYLGLYSLPNLTPHALTDHKYSAKFRGEVKCEHETLRYRLTCKSIKCTYEDDDKTLHSMSLVFVAEILYRDNIIGICDNLGAGFTRSTVTALAKPLPLGEPA